jgi:hypothetical protein
MNSSHMSGIGKHIEYFAAQTNGKDVPGTAKVLSEFISIVFDEVSFYIPS